jgi:PleD family two-component response regulator
MPNPGPKRVLAVLADLFFTVKIHEAVKRSGMEMEIVKTAQDALAKAAGNPRPALVILDLNFAAVEPLQLIADLKADENTRGISIVGYISHVQAELKQQAQEAGCDAVLARSAFSQNLPQILKRHSGVLS